MTETADGARRALNSTAACLGCIDNGGCTGGIPAESSTPEEGRSPVEGTTTEG